MKVLVDSKKCACCGSVEPASNFHKKTRSSDGLHNYCKPCTRKKNRKWVRENKERHAESCAKWYKNNKGRASMSSSKHHYKKYYGLTIEEVKQMLESQGNTCKICKKGLRFDGTKGRDKAVVDHCHVTNNVRGLLCTKCNLMLGYADDDTYILKRGIKYLKEGTN